MKRKKKLAGERIEEEIESNLKNKKKVEQMAEEKRFEKNRKKNEKARLKRKICAQLRYYSSVPLINPERCMHIICTHTQKHTRTLVSRERLSRYIYI